MRCGWWWWRPGRGPAKYIHFFPFLHLHGHRQGKSINLTHPLLCLQCPHKMTAISRGMFRQGTLPGGLSLRILPANSRHRGTGLWKTQFDFSPKRRKSFSRVTHTSLAGKTLFSLGPQQFLALLLSGKHGLSEKSSQTQLTGRFFQLYRIHHQGN